MKRLTLRTRTAGIVLALSLLSGAAQAVPVFYFDEASFLTAAASAGLVLSTEGFVGATDGGTTITFATGSVTGSGPNLDTRDTDGDNVAVGWSAGSPLTWTLNTPTYAFGIDVQDCCEINPFEINMAVNGVNHRFGFPSAQGELNLQFIGAIDTAAAFSTVSMTAPSGDFHIFDRLQLGSAAVPEPATLLLLGAGLAGVGCRRRRAA